MKTLYKYYSDRFNVIDHIKTPSIKLSTTKSFNDPFEKNITSELSQILTSKLKSELAPIFKRYDDEEYISVYKEISKNYGVVSLTETHRNVLMWSHYASSHRGLCIGYNSDFFEKLDKIDPLYHACEPLYKPQRVRYDYKRFDINQINNEQTQFELLMQEMTTKSDEWMYEKEHRCIVPFSWADKFSIYKNENAKLKALINKKIKENAIAKIINESNGDKITYSFEPSIGILEKREIAAYNEVTILKNIGIESIDSIYLGCEHNEDNTNILKKLITSNPFYQHIKLYKYKTNADNFSLDLLTILKP
ncbi:DUF2971 domain-containing protein [Aeromonas salmonicida]|uniref:DUF2971 domain-containing protein n=1 Tax=Aeromonas salmonicida TaxID=645 RepID=UPI003F7CA987